MSDIKIIALQLIWGIRCVVTSSMVMVMIRASACACMPMYCVSIIP